MCCVEFIIIVLLINININIIINMFVILPFSSRMCISAEAPLKRMWWPWWGFLDLAPPRCLFVLMSDSFCLFVCFLYVDEQFSMLSLYIRRLQFVFNISFISFNNKFYRVLKWSATSRQVLSAPSPSTRSVSIGSTWTGVEASTDLCKKWTSYIFYFIVYAAYLC